MNKVFWSMFMEAVSSFTVRCLRAVAFGYHLGQTERDKLRSEIADLKLQVELLQNENTLVKERLLRGDAEFVRKYVLGRNQD